MFERLRIIVLFVILLWVIEFINLGVGNGLNAYGIVPRNITGLRGILFAPFLHGSIAHLAANTVPLLILGIFLVAPGSRRFLQVSIPVVLLGGLFVWCIGRNATHIGASGLLFGWFGYLLADGWYTRSARSVLLALATVLLYGGLVFGVLPGAAWISWEYHLGGFLAGILTARGLPGLLGGRGR